MQKLHLTQPHYTFRSSGERINFTPKNMSFQVLNVKYLFSVPTSPDTTKISFFCCYPPTLKLPKSSFFCCQGCEEDSANLLILIFSKNFPGKTWKLFLSGHRALCLALKPITRSKVWASITPECQHISDSQNKVVQGGIWSPF